MYVESAELVCGWLLEHAGELGGGGGRGWGGQGGGEAMAWPWLGHGGARLEQSPWLWLGFVVWLGFVSGMACLDR